MKKTIRKVLDELNKDTPRLDYIKGMLEVLIEDEGEEKTYKYIGNGEAVKVQSPVAPPTVVNPADLPPAPNFKNVVPPTDG